MSDITQPSVAKKYGEDYYERKNTEIIVEHVIDKDKRAMVGFVIGFIFGVVIPAVVAGFFGIEDNHLATPAAVNLFSSNVDVTAKTAIFWLVALVLLVVSFYAAAFTICIYSMTVTRRKLAAWGLFFFLAGPVMILYAVSCFALY